MRIAKWLIEGGKALIELGDHFSMQEARLDALGARREPPKEKGEYDESIVDALIASRAESTDEDWLRSGGRRDQECVRYGVTREQVAGILAAGTKREKKNGNGNTVPAPTIPVSAPTSIAVSTPPAQKPVEKNMRNMFDAKEWGFVPIEKGGSSNQIPAKPFREITEYDKGLVILVYASCVEHKKDWNDLRHQLCCVRRLTAQQVAGIIAVHHRIGKKIRAPVAQA